MNEWVHVRKSYRGCHDLALELWQKEETRCVNGKVYRFIKSTRTEKWWYGHEVSKVEVSVCQQMDVWVWFGWELYLLTRQNTIIQGHGNGGKRVTEHVGCVCWSSAAWRLDGCSLLSKLTPPTVHGASRRKFVYLYGVVPSVQTDRHTFILYFVCSSLLSVLGYHESCYIN